MADSQKPLHLETKLSLAGRDPARSDGAVNPVLHRATTLVIEDTNDLYDTPKKTYAIEGMAVQQALKDAVVAVEGGASAILAPSGLAACTLALMTVAKAGAELLVTDAVYGPTRRFCDTILARMGVKTRYFDPRIGAGIAALLNDDTCAVFLESPGSLTFEVQDVPAIAAAARSRGIPVMLDNTWSAGMYFSPFQHGVDLSIQALTKYQAGHADAFMGAVIAGTANWAARVQAAYKQLGLGASPDDAYLVLRGMRTMAVRLERQSANALHLAQWLEDQPQVDRVLHPALASHPDHALWRRDFTGASGVFGFVLRRATADSLKRMLEDMRIFAMGFSWGGYESLIVPSDIRRTATRWPDEGHLLRVSIGLEHVEDLKADLADGLAKLSQ